MKRAWGLGGIKNLMLTEAPLLRKEKSESGIKGRISSFANGTFAVHGVLSMGMEENCESLLRGGVPARGRILNYYHRRLVGGNALPKLLPKRIHEALRGRTPLWRRRKFGSHLHGKE